MSFLETLRSKKDSLRTTNTVVTLPDGRRFVESQNNLTELSQTCGFVIDTKPDDVPAEVIDHLFLGAQDCCELQVLAKFSIKHVLSLGIQPYCTNPSVNYKFIRCLDIPEVDIISVIQNSVPFIQNALGKKENILIHCSAGVSRSSSVVIGFLILIKNFTYHEAFEFVKSKRMCIKPNEGFVKQLKSLATKY